MVSLALTISAQSSEIDTADESKEASNLELHLRTLSLAPVQCSEFRVTEEMENNAPFFDLDGPAVRHCQTTIGGQIIYVGIERIHENNLNQLIKLGKTTCELANSDNGLLSIWSRFGLSRPNLKSQIMQAAGFTQSEFDNFELLLTQYVEAYTSYKQLNEGVFPISLGTAGADSFLRVRGKMHCDTSDGTRYCIGDKHYFVYASNTPITGAFSFPKGFLEEKINLKQYMEYFKDLVMIMDFSKEPDNQDLFGGIFRNPINYVLDGKKYEDADLFIKLLAYTGAVTQGIGSMIFPVYSISIVESMYLMNVKGWQPGECIITKDSSERDILTYSDEDPHCLLFSKGQIKHSALASRF